ncbi:MAG: fluoride efflux transporter CrcB [Bacteroidia bacterium]|jgi:CrcB protein
MKSILVVALGGALGTVARYLLSIWLKQSYVFSFPWHTLLINITGCLLMGIAFALFKQHSMPSTMQLFLMVGILGGYTTFSSFGLETWLLLENRAYMQACCYVAGSNLLGIGAVIGGYFMVNSIRG